MTLITKYIIVCAYFLLVMGISFAISKIFKNNEISRNIVHICAGLGWIFYKVLFPATIHPIIISSGCVLLTLITSKFKIRFIERESGSFGTVFFTSSMLVMSLLGYKNQLLFNIFGIAIICLSCGDAMANIIGKRYGTRTIYMKKSIQGTVACFGASVLAMFVLEYLFGIGLNFVDICLLAILCAITELFAGDYDNIAIPAVLYMTAYIIFIKEDTAHFYISLAVGLFMFGFAMRLKLLNIAASFMLFFLVFILYYFGGVKSFSFLMLMFSVLIVIEKVLKRRTSDIFESVNKEHGVRNERQLLANCLVAVITVVIYGITKEVMYLVAFSVAIGETIGDSVASDVGVLSKKEPIDICSFRRVPRGVSGGVSLIGTAVSFGVCVYAAVIYAFIYVFDLYSLLVIAFSSFAGIILDSILGAKIQAQYQCIICAKITEKECHCQKETKLIKGNKILDNTRVNMVCNVFSAGLACLLMAIR